MIGIYDIVYLLFLNATSLEYTAVGRATKPLIIQIPIILISTFVVKKCFLDFLLYKFASFIVKEYRVFCYIVSNYLICSIHFKEYVHAP